MREGEPNIAKSKNERKIKTKNHPSQLSLFQPKADPLRDYLRNLIVDDISPRQALEAIYNLKGMAEQ